MPSLPWSRHADPWWDLDGRGARRTRLRQQVEAALAFALAIAACGITAAMWLREFAPAILSHLG